MKILTSLNDLHEAQEILLWLKTNKINATLEGQIAKTITFIPNGLGIYVHDDTQFQKAKHLLIEFDARFRQGAKKKKSILRKLKEKNLDKIIVAIGAAAFTIFIIWFASKLVL